MSGRISDSDYEESEADMLHLADPITVQHLLDWDTNSHVQPHLWGTTPTVSLNGSIGDLQGHIWISIFDATAHLLSFAEPPMPNRKYTHSLFHRPAQFARSFLPALLTRLCSSIPSIHLPPPSPLGERDASQPLPHSTLGTLLVTIVQLHGPPLTPRRS